MTLTYPQNTAKLPTRFGFFKIFTVPTDRPQMPHVVLVNDSFDNTNQAPLVRIHSECFTGDVLGSQRCDCEDQLHMALQTFGKEGGILLYLRQEGRGIGLEEKIKTYILQEQGYDTVDAQIKLHLPVDGRDYKDAADILKSLGINSIRLLTNNPEKIADITLHGINVVERVPIVTTANEFNKTYLTTKKEKMGHLFGSCQQS